MVDQTAPRLAWAQRIALVSRNRLRRLSSPRRSPCGTGDPHAGGFFRGPPARDISAPAPRPRRARETWTAGSAAGFVAPAPGPAPAHEGTGLARGLPAAARRLNFKLKFNLAWSAASANGPPLSATSRRGSRGRPRRVLPRTAGSFPSPAGPRPRPSAGSAGSGPAGPPSRRGSSKTPTSGIKTLAISFPPLRDACLKLH